MKKTERFIFNTLLLLLFLCMLAIPISSVGLIGYKLPISELALSSQGSAVLSAEDVKLGPIEKFANENIESTQTTQSSSTKVLNRTKRN